MHSSKSIIEHISEFLDYCDVEKGLRNNTQKNYNEYLNKFFRWLKYKNLEHILPHQPTPEHIWEYRLYLSRYQDPRSGKSLKKTTQNYYLIALRAFLSYFVAKDIVSLPPGKVTLPKPDKSVKTIKFLTLEQINALLDAPAGKNPIALRDKALLHTIVSTGLKVRQIANLEKDFIKDLPKSTTSYIRDYLKTRQDNNEKSLFINYGGRKDASKRLTTRSIERIVKNYGKSMGFEFSITPEFLRFANILSTWNKEILIEDVLWQECEIKITKELKLLKENISVMPERYRSHSPLNDLLKCDDCIFRKIAVLIVDGLINVEKTSVKDSWPDFCFGATNKRVHSHGKDWHRKMIDSVAQYFNKINGKNKITIEPILTYGRADIGIFCEDKRPIYIEIGTVSIFKIWYNLMVMSNSTFILVPDDNYIIKFEN